MKRIELRSERKESGAARIVSAELAHDLDEITQGILQKEGNGTGARHTTPDFFVPDADAVIQYCACRLKNWIKA